ncbi:DUF2235 domain-containing protein [Afipia sp. Root123D2]|uniref:DUF2235 domain-containing protein n=1 Tax=Afipia sp. Root123D2 TaxID=1736436 RepID=UPI0009E83C28|nr:DUF2235 domain-containing protein [Afipia sp. Root123D2]
MVDVESAGDPATPGSKNVVIFSDGTGQRGGVFFDEDRTNIYKLYRAARVGPDTSIDPRQQVAFYDPGLGTQPAGGNTVTRTWRTLYNFVSQATGLGVTRNIIDCYAAVIEHWRPGDRIFLFGFSRGAYTVRCLATVLAYCGIPTHGKSGAPLLRDKSSTQRVAAEAVKSVYQHVSSPRDAKYFDQRRALAARFRKKYGAVEEQRSSFPFFIGVFDTVAALSNRGSLAILASAVVGALLTLSLILALAGGDLQKYWYWLPWLTFDTALLALAAYIYTHLKFAVRLDGFKWWETVHLTTFRQKFYDDHLDTRTGYARHAISLDERRADFQRVKWGNSRTEFTIPGKIPRFRQLWFAGNHADIGGGYAENESRLSDITLSWMLDEATSLTDESLLVDRSVLALKPSFDGKQHDETRSLLFRLAGKSDRAPVSTATLHESVKQRFEFEAVLQYDVMAKYRPESLRTHEGFERYYDDVPWPHITFWQSLKQAWWSRSIRSAFSSQGEGRDMEKALSCIGFVLGLVGIFGGGGILLAQIGHWLMTAEWRSMPLSTVGSCLHRMLADWRGLQQVFDWILKLPLSLVIFLTGYLLFWFFGVLSTKAYQRWVKRQRKIATPAQTQA